MDGPPSGEICSICHGNFNVPCQANCSHWFCGNCIILVWNHGSSLHPCRCPLCRREITLLVPSEASTRQQSSPEVARILNRIKTYNRFFGGNSTGLVQRMRDLPFLIRRLTRELMDPRRSLPFFIKARVFLAIAVGVVYVVSPIDFIPEAIVGLLGLVDDILIVLICFLHVAAAYRAVLYARHG